jgi:acyl-CoA dehydrogenase
MVTLNPAKLVRNSFLGFARSKMPSVSQSEQEALEAGTTGWEESIFNGSPDWKKIIGGYPKPKLTEAEQSFLDNEVEELCAMVNTTQNRKNQDLPPEVWDFLKKKGFFGLLIPEEYGGHGFSALARSAIVKKISSHDTVAGVTVMVPNSLGPGEMYLRYGTQEQKDTWLRKLANGETIPCFALTELNAGSDALSIQAKGIVKKDETSGEIYIEANFEKRYITLAPVADILGLAIDVEDPDGLLPEGAIEGFTAAVIPTDREGVDITQRLNPLNIGFMNGAPSGKNVRIEMNDVIGGVEMVGKGWPMFAQLLAEGRANSLPSQGSAAAEFSLLTSTAYTRVRQQFGMSINKFKGMDELIAEIAGLSYLNDAGRIATNQMVDNGEKPAVPSAILKYHATENMRTAINHTMDIHGGKGIMEGENNYLAAIYKAIPVGITVEGSNPMTRNMLIFGQGSYRLHPYLSKIKHAIDEGQAMKAAKNIAMAFVVHPVASNLKAIASTLTGGRFGPSAPVKSDMEEYYNRINQLSAVFNAIAPQMATYMGGRLKSEEAHSAMLGDALGHLYMAATALKHYHNRGSLHGEKPIAEWSLQYSLNKAQEALKTITRADNSPFAWYHPGRWSRPLQWILARSTNNAAPSFSLNERVAEVVTIDNQIREGLTNGVYVSKDPNDPIAKLEKAFKLACENEHLEKKLKAFDRKNDRNHSTPMAQRVEFALAAEAITQEEATAILETQAARDAVNMVDSFTIDMKPTNQVS